MKPLELDAVTRSYSRGWRRQPVNVLRGITLTVEPGECFGYLGANGAGKTTTMKILLGFIRPSSGEARLWGEPASNPRARRRIGFVSEEPSLPPRFTPRELLVYGGRLCGMPGPEARRRADELIARLGIEAQATSQLRRMSKGQRQRVALAHALVTDPELLLLDEPLTGLDALGRREVIDLLGELRAAGKTIFMSSHILADVERLCDRVAILRQGMLLATGTPAGVADEQGLAGFRFEDVFLHLVAPDYFASQGARGRRPAGQDASSVELMGV